MQSFGTYPPCHYSVEGRKDARYIYIAITIVGGSPPFSILSIVIWSNPIESQNLLGVHFFEPAIFGFSNPYVGLYGGLPNMSYLFDTYHTSRDTSPMVNAEKKYQYLSSKIIDQDGTPATKTCGSV